MSIRNPFAFGRREKKTDHVLFYLCKQETEWVRTGRIDFAISLYNDDEDVDLPSEFKLLVEEHRIVESIAGNIKKLEIQWRLATIEEAKAVITHYNKYLLQKLQKEGAEAFCGSGERKKMMHKVTWKNRDTYQGVVKREWVATGRIDFATRLNGDDDADQPSEFKLLVEERRIVESLTGNENLEIQWRLATLREAKAVATNYHKYLTQHSLIKSVFDDDMVALPPPKKNVG